MDNIDRELEALIAQNASKLSVGAQKAFAICSGSFQFGCNWGFLKSDTLEFKSAIEMLKEEKGNIRVNQMKNGILVTCREDYLMWMLDTLMGGKSPISYPELANRRKKEFNKFAKWLAEVQQEVRTKGSPVSRNIQVRNIGGKRVYVITYALYGINDTGVIRVNNISYPSFKLTLPEAFSIAQNVGVSASQFLNCGSDCSSTTALINGMKSMTISSANTGAFISLNLN